MKKQDNHDKYLNKYMQYSERMNSYVPLDKETIIKNISEFLQETEGENVYSEDIKNRVSDAQHWELNFIIRSIIETKWCSGHRGRYSPVQFRTVNKEKRDEMPYFVTPERKEEDPKARVDELIHYCYGLSGHLNSMMREIEMIKRGK